MYGTVARMQAKPGQAEALIQLFEAFNAEQEIAGHVSDLVYRSDADPNVFFMAVAFEDRASYEANANSPAMHEMYLRYRALLAADPDWHDGEIVSTG